MNPLYQWPLSPDTQPDYHVPSYRSTQKRSPKAPLVRLPSAARTPGGPEFSPLYHAPQADLSRVEGKEALGERIVVQGRVTDERERPVPNTIIEVWQANAAGRYHHPEDQHDAPIDPNFRGFGRVFTDGDGRYRFVSIKPGAYPWKNHLNAWRPNHIHLSLFGPAWGSRLVTQMYFQGDPLLEMDPIYNAIPDAAARSRLIAAFDLPSTLPDWALGYRFDIVLRGLHQTPFEHEDPSA
jgi:protocatechuate 3,4-dioxygenase beta subunit